MIKPLVSPTTITGNATTGLISAARSGLRNIQKSTETISKAPDVTKEQGFGMNYIGFFGSKKVGKDLKKSMLTIRDSISSTFGIVKSLKESVTKGTGVFGFIGKAIRFGALALPFLPFFGVIKTILGLVAVGGIGALLFKFKDDIVEFFERTEIASKIFNSIKTNAIGFTSYIKNIIAEFLVSRGMSAEFQTIRKASESRLSSAILKSGETQDSVITARDNEVKLLRKEKEDFKVNQKPDRNAPDESKDFYRNTLKAIEDRITELETGRVPVEEPLKTPFKILGRQRNIPGTKFLDVIGKFAGDVTAQQGIYSQKDLEGLSGKERLDLIKSTLREFQNREDISKAKLIYGREYDSDSLLNLNQIDQARDILDYLDEVEDPFANNEKIDKQFIKQLDNIYPIMPKAKSKSLTRKIFDSAFNLTPVGRAVNSGTNLSVLPMGNSSPQPDLARNLTGGLSSGPSMRLYSNVDHDNFVALINKSSLNVV